MSNSIGRVKSRGYITFQIKHKNDDSLEHVDRQELSSIARDCPRSSEGSIISGERGSKN